MTLAGFFSLVQRGEGGYFNDFSSSEWHAGGPWPVERSVEDEDEDSGGDTLRWNWCRRKALCHMLM